MLSLEYLKELFDLDEEENTRGFFSESSESLSLEGLKARKKEIREAYLQNYSSIFEKIRVCVETRFDGCKTKGAVYKHSVLMVLDKLQKDYDLYRSKERRQQETAFSLQEKLEKKGLSFEGSRHLFEASLQEQKKGAANQDEGSSTRSISSFISKTKTVTQMAEVLHRPSINPRKEEDFFSRKKSEIQTNLNLSDETTDIDATERAYNELYSTNGHIYSINLGVFREGDRRLSIKYIFAGMYLISEIQKINPEFISSVTVYVGSKLIELDINKLAVVLNYSFDLWKETKIKFLSSDERALLNFKFTELVDGKIKELLTSLE